jgi:hypothetical protein
MMRLLTEEMGLMRATYFRLAGLGTAILALLCGMAYGQQTGSYSPPDVQLPLPMGSTNVDGGLFTAASFVSFRQTNPLRNQVIAYQGFVDVDGSVQGGDVPGTFIGSHQVALDSRQVSGPQTYQPGTKIDIGWKFAGDDAGTLVFSWMWLAEAKYNANVTLANNFLQLGPSLENSFQFSPVYNFPIDYAGEPNKVTTGSPFALFGIWNGSTEQAIQYVQRVQQWDLTYRVPYYETETTRLSGLVGGRFFWLWDGFTWKTIDVDDGGNSGPLTSAQYSNVTSNRMYGVHVGLQQEWYLGHGFAVSLEGDVAAFCDIVKERVKYEFLDKFTPPQSKYSRTDYTIAGEASANLALQWYVYEGIQIRASYDVMAFANTIASTLPVAFNWGAPIPEYDHVSRFFDGFTFGVAFIW